MRKFLIILTSLVSLLLLGAPVAYAQEATDTPDAGWPVEERCIGAPTKPPKDWSYDGTILMTGYAGIHGINAKWDIPHVLVFLGNNNIWGGALSPDGKWYVSPIAWTEYTDGNNTVTTTNKISIYSTVDSKLSHFISWNSALIYNGTYPRVYWRDNNHFAYPAYSGWQLVDIFTDTITPWDKFDKVYDSYDMSIPRLAPDWSKVIYYNRNTWNEPVTINLRDVSSKSDIATLGIKQPILWKPDSTAFIGNVSVNKTYGDKTLDEKLALFDNQGVLQQIVFTPPEGQQIGPLSQAWSSDGRYFAFITYNYMVLQGKPYLGVLYKPENTLYILDNDRHRIINTCLKVGSSFAWSPDHYQLAFVQSLLGQQPIQIYDLDTEKTYSIAYHTGSVIGWHSD